MRLIFFRLTALARGHDTHHFQPEGTELIPNLLMMAMHLCGVTKHINIGCGFNIVPMWHPLRLAEDYAMADILTGGRVIFGVGRGYHTREVETFGSPLLDQNANRELLRIAATCSIRSPRWPRCRACRSNVALLYELNCCTMPAAAAKRRSRIGNRASSTSANAT